MDINRSNKRLGVLSLLAGILILGLTGSGLANPLETDIGDTPYFLLDTRTLLETDLDETPSFTLDTRAPLETDSDDTLSFTLDTRAPLETDADDTLSFTLDTRAPLETDLDETLSFMLDTRAPLVALHTTSQHGYILKEPDLQLHEYGTTLTLTATPDTGYVFTGWSGDISSEDQQDNPLILTMDGDKTLTANFEKKATKPAIWLISNLDKAGKGGRNEL